MAALADTIDFFGSFFSQKSALKHQVDSRALIGSVYVAFAFVWFLIFGLLSDTDFSSILTAGATMQCMGFVLLSIKVRATNSVKGLSSRSLELFVGYFLTRLCATSVKNGYIPVDTTGDFIYQLMDFCSLCCVVHILYRMHKTYRNTYDKKHDQFQIKPLIVQSILVGFIIHGDFNRSPFFDSLWSASVNLETIAMWPQMRMIALSGGEVDAVTLHFIGCYVLACVCRFEFWWYAAAEFESTAPAVHVVLMHLAQLVLCGDFVFCYARAYINGEAVDELPTAESLDAEMIKAEPEVPMSNIDFDDLPCSWR